MLHELRRWLPLAPIALAAGVLAWLNQNPWWGWVLPAALLAGLGLTARWWLRGRRLLRVGAWLLAGILVATVAIAAHPPPRNRLAGGEDSRPTPAVPTRQGPVTGVHDADRSVEVFAGGTRRATTGSWTRSPR
ncbi:hypothetical protein OWR29_00280 [Actinoplanes sp. Pm04-4]|uniref:Competence protein ComEC n=1 Tax=Paractinoplanes pyxinae TaxID=2997416 RepID=A0ABT4AQA2_9ACTN|nr:hypothetical protein [Actinoplanes pyxinae]MCY1136415.1 hypothetical protein [Actinoplanes pyxinae]